jgi:hypothetical protein
MEEVGAVAGAGEPTPAEFEAAIDGSEDDKDRLMACLVAWMLSGNDPPSIAAQAARQRAVFIISEDI